MLTEQWHLWLAGAALAVHALLAYRVYRVHRRSADDAAASPVAGSSTGDPVDAEAGVVECPDCGAENELDYRFCRDCVAELPGATRFQRDAPEPRRRLT